MTKINHHNRTRTAVLASMTVLSLVVTVSVAAPRAATDAEPHQGLMVEEIVFDTLTRIEVQRPTNPDGIEEIVFEAPTRVEAKRPAIEEIVVDEPLYVITERPEGSDRVATAGLPVEEVVVAEPMQVNVPAPATIISAAQPLRRSDNAVVLVHR